MKIGLFGGSFDPVHIGHLILAQRACERFKLDQVLFVPAGQTPHKAARCRAQAADRLRMLRTAVRGNPRFAVCDWEIRRGGVSYTIDTVRHLQRRLGAGVRLHLIIGLDLLPGLAAWREAEELLSRVHVLVGTRAGAPAARAPGRSRVSFFEIPGVELSSTQVRRMIVRGESVRYLLPEGVERYVRQKGIYRKKTA